MNWDIIEGRWTEMKGKAREQWGKLTDDDLEVIAGRREKLSGTLQRVYGKTREEVEREMDEWAVRHNR
ncbi:MAG: CsbD family protein [Phycisphaerales bacterium]